MDVEGPLVITPLGETLLQTRPDQEKGIIGPASPLLLVLKARIVYILGYI